MNNRINKFKTNLIMLKTGNGMRTTCLLSCAAIHFFWPENLYIFFIIITIKNSCLDPI